MATCPQRGCARAERVSLINRRTYCSRDSFRAICLVIRQARRRSIKLLLTHTLVVATSA